MKHSADKILIVDDDRFVRMALSEALRSWNYEVVEADSVASAMKILAGEKLAIVLLDIDVIVLAKYYLDKVNVKRRGQHLVGLSPEVDKIFRNYQWSGNVRELRNVIERASILEDGDTVTPTH